MYTPAEIHASSDIRSGSSRYVHGEMDYTHIYTDLRVQGFLVFIFIEGARNRDGSLCARACPIPCSVMYTMHPPMRPTSFVRVERVFTEKHRRCSDVGWAAEP